MRNSSTRRLIRPPMLAALLAAAAPAFAEPVPLSYTGPDAAGATAAVRALVSSFDPRSSVSTAALRSGLEAVAAGRIAEAIAARDALPADSLDSDALTWAIATHGGAGVPSKEIAAARGRLDGWPGLEALRRNQERSFAREKPRPAAVLRVFAGAAPETFQGVVLLARAHVALKDDASARRVLSPWWRREKLEPAQEAAVLREFGNLLTTRDHRVRMERMLYAERARSADRLAALAGAAELCSAWTAVVRREKNAAELLEAVPAGQRSAGYFFAKAKLLRWGGKFGEAAATMAAAPKHPDALIDPEAWWIERRVLSRELLDIGDAPGAYRVAADHAAQRPTNVADAEFHAGWYALRSLGDAPAAAVHFARITEIAEGPLSLSRAYYWLGRAVEAGGPGNAQAYYERAATYGTSFYGQLAAERLGRADPAIRQPAPTAEDRARFHRRRPVAAIRRLEAAGHSRFAEKLYRDLAAEMTNPGEVALLIAAAEQRGNHFLALRLAKAAAARGVDVGALTHPVGAIPSGAAISDSGKALAYAVARQESEFNAGAVSSAGARGLLQLLPGTAREMAKRTGLPYSQARLTSDAGYNATLGSAFLGQQIGRFDGSYVLAVAGYNAGPRRAREWVERYGDPRGKDIDAVVDWIERIPFTETRSYVQRVMENYQVYKLRLSGEFDIVGDLVRGG